MKNIYLFLVIASFVFAEKVHITAERFYVDQKARYSVFGGKVNIKKGQDELNASKVYIYFDEKNKPLIYQADGKVRFHIETDDKAIYVGRCESLVYSPLKKEYHFMKNVKIYEEKNNRTLNGEKIVVNTEQGTANVEGERKKPIRITLDLDDNGAGTRKGLNATEGNESSKHETK